MSDVERNIAESQRISQQSVMFTGALLELQELLADNRKSRSSWVDEAAKTLVHEATPLAGQPLKGVLWHRRYYVERQEVHREGQEIGDLLQHEVPRGFTDVNVHGILVAIKSRFRVGSAHQEILAAVDPFAMAENEDIKAYYERIFGSKNHDHKLHSPLGIKKRDRDRRFWLPVAALQQPEFDVAYLEDGTELGVGWQRHILVQSQRPEE